MKTFFLISISSFLLFTSSFGQKILPNNFSPEEKARISTYSVPLNRAAFTSAPNNSNLRTAAEWEEMRGIVISWQGFETFLTNIVSQAQEEGLVYIFCNDSNSVRNTLQNNSISLNNIRCIQENTNSVWIRDYGANNVYFDEVGQLVLTDWVYNRNRPDDDTSPEKLAEYINIDIYASSSAPTDLVNTGGNFMTDGLGNSFASNLVMEENESTSSFNSTPKTESEVNDIMNDYMGIQSYIKMPVLDYDDIHHIDMHMKLLDEETLLVGEYPDGISDGPKIEQNLQYILDNYNSTFGTAYKVVRIPMPIGENWSGNPAWPDNSGTYNTYTNSLIINNKVLVPIYNIEMDAEALEIYETAMPGYQIIGIDANEPIQYSGAIHCTTHEIAIDEPLWIVHQAIQDQEASLNSYEISAQIKHINGIANAKVYYKINDEISYNSVDMNLISGDTWSAQIPQQSPNTNIHYYIEAIANSGKTINRPLPAPNAYWSFKILTADNVKIINKKTKLKYYNQNKRLYVYYTIQETSNTQIDLFDINGKYISNIYKGKSTHGLNQYSINSSNLPTGLYFIKAQIDHQIINKKVIIE